MSGGIFLTHEGTSKDEVKERAQEVISRSLILEMIPPGYPLAG
jgi:hypothetical protein